MEREYEYKIARETLFTDDGQKMFLKIRDKAKKLLMVSGAFRMIEVIEGSGGDSWQMIACVERMVELNEIVECKNPISGATQHKIYTSLERL